MYGWFLSIAATWLGSLAALRYPLIGLNVFIGLAVLRPQFLFNFAGDLSGLSQIAGFAVLLGWAGKRCGSWQFGRARPVMTAYMVYLAWYFISSRLALNPGLAYGALFPMAKLAMPLFVGVTLMRGEKDWRPTLWTIVLCQGYVGLEMNMNYVLKSNNTAMEGFGGMDNNCFGVSLVTVLGPAVALMLSSKGWVGRLLAGASAALILHTIMLTFSRGAMLGLLAVGATVFVMMPKRPKQISALIVVSLLALRFMGPQLMTRYASTFASHDERDSSAESRLDLWRDCFIVIEQYPIFGVGPANWRTIAARYGWPEGKSAHSVWVESSAEVGIPGAIALLLFFVIAAVRLWPIARAPVTEANQYEVVLASGVILSIVGFVVSGQFVSIPSLEAPYYMVMLGAAMLKTTQLHGGKVAVPATVFIPRSAYGPALPLRSFPGAGPQALKR